MTECRLGRELILSKDSQELHIEDCDQHLMVYFTYIMVVISFLVSSHRSRCYSRLARPASLLQRKSLFASRIIHPSELQRDVANGAFRKLFSTNRTAASAGDLSDNLRSFQSSLASDEKTRLVLDALRGRNLNDDDQQGRGIDMKIVEMASSGDSSDVLPQVYDPHKLQKYFDRRPGAVATRVWQIFSTSFGYLFDLATDYLTGNTQDIEVRRAAELRNTIVSLGPFFIKLGQALSIRPDILSPRAMVELQQLCDKVPCFENQLAMRTIEEELGKPVHELFKDMSPDPVAAASLGQVYRAKLVSTGEEVAVKVQRPFVLETVSLDLHLVRQIGLFLRRFPAITNRLDIVSLLDEFANNFYQELDYNLECQNGLRVMKDMAKLPRVVIPKPYASYCTRRVHTAQWVDGEKLSQSKANDVGALVNLGVITYLTQLLETGFFHADPHPGNMLRTPEGKLVILDFGLMTQITDDQKFGMMEAIAHLIHRDYTRIGHDFVNLGFIPREVDTTPIVPALARVFDAALAGGGAKSIDFQELVSDLAEITFRYPFRIPPYFALIIRAISVLEGIALVGNPEFAIVDEAYPFIAKRLLTDRSPRAREAFRYMIYGQSNTLDVDRMIDILQAFEKFMRVKDDGDGTSYKQRGRRGDVYVGRPGDAVGTRSIRRDEEEDEEDDEAAGHNNGNDVHHRREQKQRQRQRSVREALRLFFSDEGQLLREFIADEVLTGLDALSRDAVRELLQRLRLLPLSPPPPPSSSKSKPSSWWPRWPVVPSKKLWSFMETASPSLTTKERETIDGLVKLVSFFLGAAPSSTATATADDRTTTTTTTTTDHVASQLASSAMASIRDRRIRQQLRQEYWPLLQEFAPNMRAYGGQLVKQLIRKGSSRVFTATLDAMFGPDPDVAIGNAAAAAAAAVATAAQAKTATTRTM